METKHKYISRYEKAKGGGYTFCGWRLCITRDKERYVRYFSDKQYTNSQAALLAALEAREKILEDFRQGKVGNTAEYFRMCRRLEN